MTDQIIDPPVTPYSSTADIEAWIAELERMSDSDAVREALDSARAMLVAAREREAEV